MNNSEDIFLPLSQEDITKFEEEKKHKKREDFLKQYKGKWKVRNDGTYDLTGDLHIIGGEIFVPFNEVTGDVVIVYTDIKTLKNFPKKVGGDIDISYNYELSSLKGLPEIVNGYLNASHCNLVSLEGLPKIIKGCLCLTRQKSGVKFDKEEIREISEVSGRIMV